MKRFLFVALFLLFITPVSAGEVTVVEAKARATGKDTFHFSVTLRHGDTGSTHYADNWEVLDPEGKLLGRRVLLHPHETEQPFTRSLGGVKIPAGIKKVTIRGHDKVHKYGGKDLVIDLPGR